MGELTGSALSPGGRLAEDCGTCCLQSTPSPEVPRPAPGSGSPRKSRCPGCRGAGTTDGTGQLSTRHSGKEHSLPTSSLFSPLHLPGVLPHLLCYHFLHLSSHPWLPSCFPSPAHLIPPPFHLVSSSAVTSPLPLLSSPLLAISNSCPPKSVASASVF